MRKTYLPLSDEDRITLKHYPKRTIQAQVVTVPESFYIKPMGMDIPANC